MSYLVFDLLIGAVLLIALARGYSRGFVLTLCGFLAVFVAFIGASVLSNALAEPVAKVIEPIVVSRIHDTVSNYHDRSAAEHTAQEESDWLDQLPLEEVLEPLRESQFFQSIAETFQRAVDNGTAGIAAHAVQALAHFAAVQIARTVLFALCFAAVLLAWTLLSRALDLVARLPVLNALNRWGGGAVGLCRGALLVLIALWLFRGRIPPGAEEHTFLLPLFLRFDPLALLVHATRA